MCIWCWAGELYVEFLLLNFVFLLICHLLLIDLCFPVTDGLIPFRLKNFHTISPEKLSINIFCHNMHFLFPNFRYFVDCFIM
jgi:hypothetical protein